MKLMLIPLAAAALGWSFWPAPATDASSSADDATRCRTDCQPGKCDVTAECTPEGTCLLEFRRADGSRCKVELECTDDGCRVVDCDRGAARACASVTPAQCSPVAER